MKNTVVAISLSMILALSIGVQAEAKSMKRSQFTKAQQAEFFKKALASCRKEYGDRLHRVQMNYTQGKYYCWIY